jgi:hypothetical protein
MDPLRVTAESHSRDNRQEVAVRLGLYRTIDPILGDAARVHPSAGDAAPYVSRHLYEMLDFRPPFECLPQVREEPGLIPPYVEGLADASFLPRLVA